MASILMDAGQGSHGRRSGRRSLIAAMTANAMAGDREACLAAGMDAKPIRGEALVEAMMQVTPRGAV